VLSSPTGSGKSTEVAARGARAEPWWSSHAASACRSLAGRVAELERTPLGAGVGYVVRDERVSSAGTRILFATPGLVLRDRTLLARADTVVLDEFHERSLELRPLARAAPARATTRPDRDVCNAWTVTGWPATSVPTHS
jgi:ATP-dependent helicase HrpB